MKKNYRKGLLVSALAAGALLLGSQAFAAHPINIVLRDASGTPIPSSGLGSDAAYSAKTTCGACHDYDAIERHSYHAQLGANQHLGWNAWAMGNWNSVATKGKPWVQSPGHLGKW